MTRERGRRPCHGKGQFPAADATLGRSGRRHQPGFRAAWQPQSDSNPCLHFSRRPRIGIGGPRRASKPGPTDAEAVLREALELPSDDRAGIAAELLASLDEPEDADTARSLWAKELEQRARLVLSGQSPGKVGRAYDSGSPMSLLGELAGPIRSLSHRRTRRHHPMV